MNYRHAYHAGNFADVVKHAVLTRVLEYLKRKDAAFRVIDTHAGRGIYDLSSEEAQKTGEWQSGIGRLMSARLPKGADELLRPYLDAVRAVNSGARLTRYPGSPAITRQLLRKQDRLSAIELHPDDGQSLARHFEDDVQARVIRLDGWLALGAHLPPKEKRGLVLVDPPFEEPGEYDRMIDGLLKAQRRWPGGIYLFWYPIKDRRAVNSFRTALKETGIPKITDITFDTRPPSPEPRLDGCGIAAINLPFGVDEELRTILSAFKPLLGEAPGARFGIHVLSGDVAGKQA
jgi:23S rRNA (adenine2030-N6)-methyltransferase